MKRKMVIIGISYILGLFFASFFTDSNIIFLVAAGAGGLMLLIMLKAITVKAALTAAVSFFVGAALYAGYTAYHYAPVVSLAGEETSFIGQVKSAEIYDGEYAAYILDGEFQNGAEASVLCFTENYDCRFGDHIMISGTFSVPDKSYLYDSTEYYKGQSVFLEADSDCTYDVLYTDGYNIIRSVSDYREKIQSRIYALTGRTGGSLTAAMIFGDRSGLDERIESSFYHSGLGPMLALSGFHLILFNGICNVIGNRTRIQRILQLAMTVVLTTLFALVAMWPVSVLRAGLMLLLARGACLFYRRSDSLSALCISVIVLTCMRPYLIHNVGFLLSVAGTFGVNSFAPWITEKLPLGGWLGTVVKMSLSAALITLCTIPVCILYFPKTSLLAPLSNVLFAPMCVIIMFCGIVIFFCGGMGGISHACGFVIDTVSALLTDCLSWIELNVPVSFPTGWDSLCTAAVILSGMTVLVYLFTRKRRMVALSVAFSIIMLFTGQQICMKRFDESLRIFVLGRNAEQVIAVTYQGRTDVIDLTGDRKNADYLLYFLTEYNIKTIDCLYIADNVNAMAAVYDKDLYAVNVKRVLAGTENSLRSCDTVCGNEVGFTDYCRITAPEYEIETEDKRLTVKAYGKVILAAQLSDLTEESGLDYIIAGGKKQQAIFEISENYGRQIMCAGQNIELIVHSDGNAYARRLY